MRQSLGLALTCLCVSLSLSWAYAVKEPCADQSSGDGRAFAGCYSDVFPLYANEGLDQGRTPLLEPCPHPDVICDEYPVVQMWLMRLAGGMSNDVRSFFESNALFLSLAAIATAMALYTLVGKDAIFFAAAPSLVFYAFHNWDLYPVAFASLALLAFRRGRYAIAGILIGIGTATKLFPALLLVPMVADLLYRGDRGGGARLSLASVGAWLAINAPFAILAREQWSLFFTFHAARGPEFTTLWYIACRIWPGSGCFPVPWINVFSGVLFVGSFAAAWAWRRKTQPEFDRWTLIFPAVVLFLLWNKVYSPQYSLWLLPMFALAFPRKWLFLGFSATDVLVGKYLLSWIGTTWGYPGVSETLYQAAALTRALILSACVVVWVLNRDDSPRQIAGRPERGGATEAG